MRVHDEIPTAAVLAGGLGTRLRPAVADRPKALAPVAGRPFVAHLLGALESAGLRRVVLLTGHRAEQVRDQLGSRFGSLELAYSQEDVPLGTAGAVRRALPLVEGETLLLLNGDSFCDADLGAFARFHGSHAGAGSMLLARVADGARFGRVEVDAGGRVTRFAEKGAAGPAWINAGVYLLSRALLAEIPAGRAASLEQEFFPRWAGEGRLFGFAGGGAFLDIGTPESYARAEGFFGAAVG